MCAFLGKFVGGWGDPYAPKATKKKMDTNALISDARHSNLIPKSCASVSVCVTNTLLFATYLTLIRSEITYVFILYIL